MLSRIACVACAALLLTSADARAQNESLLNGRYDFRAEGGSPADHVSRVGTLKFDGSGGITTARIKETVGGSSHTIGASTSANGEYRFYSGTYTVNGNKTGRITLRFVIDPQILPGVYLHEIDEEWDIAVSNGGKAFFLGVRSAAVWDMPAVPQSEELTLSGDARAVDVTGADETLLDGRYSFRAAGIADIKPVSRVGTVKFDGHGKVTAARIRETAADVQTIAGLASDPPDYPFISGTYEVNANSIGKVELVFGFKEEPVVGFLAEIHEVWDIAVANGGQEFFVNTQSATAFFLTPGGGTGVTQDLRLTVNGVGKAD